MVAPSPATTIEAGNQQQFTKKPMTETTLAR